MNVGIFASAFHPHVGGVEEMVRQLSHEFKSRSIGVTVLTNRWPRQLPAFEIVEGVNVYRFPMRTPDWNWRVRLVYALTLPLTLRKIIKTLKQAAIDIVHVQCVGSNGFYALVASRRLGVPLVVTSQGERTMDAGGVYDRSVFMNNTLRLLLDSADFITTCSKSTLTDLEVWRGRPLQSRAKVVYNGVKTTEFSDAKWASSDKFGRYILGIGRMVPQKGFDVLIRAFAMANLSSHRLLLAGDGPELSRLKTIARSEGVAESVDFAGKADRQFAVSLFRGAEFVVLPSLQEPMGIVNLEAMAAGKAIIASDTGGVPEIVDDGGCGILVEPGNVGALARAMKVLAESPELRARMGANGSVRASHFTWERVAGEYIEIYEAAMKAGSQCDVGITV